MFLSLLMGDHVHCFADVAADPDPVAPQHHPVALEAAGDALEIDEVPAGKIECGGEPFEKGFHVLLCHNVHTPSIRGVSE